MAKQSSATSWLKKIFSVSSLSLLATIIGLWIAYRALMVDAGGELSVTYSERTTEAFDHATTLVFNEQSIEAINDYLPRFENKSKYTLKDFYLKYTIKADGCEIAPSGFYNASQSREGEVMTLRDNRLAPGVVAEEPILSIVPNSSKFTFSYQVIASFNSGAEPYKASHSVMVEIHPLNGQSPQQWYSSISAKNAIAYYSPTQSKMLNPDRTEVNIVEPEPVEVHEAKPQPTETQLNKPANKTTKTTTTVTTTRTNTNEDTIKSEKKSELWWLEALMWFLFYCLSVAIVVSGSIIGLEGFSRCRKASDYSFNNFLNECYDEWDDGAPLSPLMKGVVNFLLLGAAIGILAIIILFLVIFVKIIALL